MEAVESGPVRQCPPGPGGWPNTGRAPSPINSPCVGCWPCDAGLWVCVLIDRNDLPKHLFGIPDLDLSEDLCAEPLAGPWFRLGACSTGSGRDNQVSRMWSTARACCSRQKISASYSISWSLAWVTVPGGKLSMAGTQRDQTTVWRTRRPLSCYARYRRAAVEPKPTFAPEHSHGVPTCARLMSRYEGNGQPHHRSLRAPCPRLGCRP
jgi:hypothetical protein